MTFDFTTPKDETAGRSTKWVGMQGLLGHAAPDDMLPMWIAQMDFQPAPFLLEATQALINSGEYGYFDYGRFAERVAWWCARRHDWAVEPDTIFPTHGIGHAIGLTLQALTDPGDGIIVFSPVYHEFAHKIRRNGRTLVESPLRIDDAGLYRLDLDTLAQQLTGTEKAVLFCSPHNPAGRVWEAEELRALAAFCEAHDLLLLSDEIHFDLTYPGHTHLPTAKAAPQSLPRLVVMAAASKTFDIAGLRTGYVIIPDPDLRARFARLHAALDTQPNRLGCDLTCAAYTETGAAWVDALMAVLDGNRQTLCAGLNAIPGVRAMPMQSTFLGWADFSGTGMDAAEIKTRIHDSARVLPTPGEGLGLGGALHHRFNIGTPHARVAEAVARLQEAFSDLQ